MSQADSQLCQALPEVTLGCRGCLPAGLQHLVGLEGTAFVQQSLSFSQTFRWWEVEVVWNTDNPRFSAGKGTAECVAGSGIARPTGLVAFSVRFGGHSSSLSPIWGPVDGLGKVASLIAKL